MELGYERKCWSLIYESQMKMCHLRHKNSIFSQVTSGINKRTGWIGSCSFPLLCAYVSVYPCLSIVYEYVPLTVMTEGGSNQNHRIADQGVINFKTEQWNTVSVSRTLAHFSTALRRIYLAAQLSAGASILQGMCK